MSLSSEYGKSLTAWIYFKDNTHVELHIEIPLEYIAIPLEYIVKESTDEQHNEAVYVKLSKSKQLELQIPYIRKYIED